MAKAMNPVPEGYHTLTPGLTLDNAAETIEWYKKAFGAEEISRHSGPDGKIMHADLKIGDSRFMLNDAMPGSKGPKAYGGSPVTLWLYVDNSDALFNRAVAAGAKVQMPVTDQFWGDRGGVVSDPAGVHVVDRHAQGRLVAGRVGAARRRLLQADGVVRIPLTRHDRTARELFFPRGVSSFRDNSFQTRCCTSIRSFST